MSAGPEAVIGYWIMGKKPKATSNTIGQRLAEFRKQLGMTQKDLAERLDVPQPFISRYERGMLRLHGELIVKLTKILKVSADQLLAIKNVKGSKPHINPRSLRRMNQIDELSRRDREALLRTIDTYLAKTK